MKTLLISLLALSTLTISFSSEAQNFEVPEGYVMVDSADYGPYEEDVLLAAKYLQSSFYEMSERELKSVTKFFQTWLNGTPNLKLIFTAEMTEYISDNVDVMLIQYMAGWVEYALESNDRENYTECGYHALVSMAEFAKENEGELVITKGLKKLLKMYDKGKLEKYASKINYGN